MIYAQYLPIATTRRLLRATTPPIGEYGENFLQIVPERLFNLDDDLSLLDLTKCTTIPLANKTSSALS